jgi:LPS O-antigen subunit length determinant protein (WzzB/FepE family)
MNNNYLREDYEVNLNLIFKTIWDGKIKIVLITFIVFLIAAAYNHRKPDLFQTSLNINLSNSFEFIKISQMNDFLNFDESQKIKTNKQLVERKVLNLKFLNEFIKELMDYEELISILKNNEKIKKSISNLPINDQQQILFNNAMFLTVASNVDVIEEDEVISYTLNFIFHDAKAARDILDQTLKLTSFNLKKSIFKELEDHLEIKKNRTVNMDLKKLEFLEEQALIARELNLNDWSSNANSLDGSGFYMSQGTANIYRFSEKDYYLRGYKVIDKEISIIQSRRYKEFDIIKKEIEDLKDTDMEFVNYNMFLLKTKSLKNTKKFLLDSILLGLLIGILYVLFLKNVSFFSNTSRS